MPTSVSLCCAAVPIRCPPIPRSRSASASGNWRRPKRLSDATSISTLPDKPSRANLTPKLANWANCDDHPCLSRLSLDHGLASSTGALLVRGEGERLLVSRLDGRAGLVSDDPRPA